MSATNRGAKRVASDFYATPLETIYSFLDNYDGIKSGDKILEPSAGNGNIIQALRDKGYKNTIDAIELRAEEANNLATLADDVIITNATSYSWFIWTKEQTDRQTIRVI